MRNGLDTAFRGQFMHTINGKKLLTYSQLMKTVFNNVILPIFFIVVINIVQHFFTSFRLNNIVYFFTVLFPS